MQSSKTPDTTSAKEQQGSSSTQLDPAFVDRLKVAAATAIIKQKPASMTGKEYAEQLAKRLREKEDSWKVKAKNLEIELQQTRQELLLAQSNIPAAELNNDNGASGNSSIETATSQPSFLTPPSSSEEVYHTDCKVALSKNTNFLYSLSTISSVSSQKTGMNQTEGSSKLIIKSVRTAVDSILDGCKGKSSHCSMSPKMTQEAAGGIVRCLEARATAGCREEILVEVRKLLNGVFDELLGQSNICNTFSQRESCCIILRLAKSSHLLQPILHAILDRIERTSASLRNIHHHGNSLDVQLLENSFFLFTTMEDILVSIQTSPSSKPSSKTLLKSSSSMKGGNENGHTLQSSKQTSSPEDRRILAFNTKQTSSLSSGINDSIRNLYKAGRAMSSVTGCQTPVHVLDVGFRNNIQQRLEDSLLHISHDFPLYAQYVWRLTGILDLMNQT